MKKCISVLIILAIMISICIPANASEATVSRPTVAANDEHGITPYAFSRNYEKYFTLNSPIQVMHDVNVNIFNDQFVTVTLVESKGPTKFKVKIRYREDDSLYWIDGIESEVVLNGSVNYNIPVGNAFSVMAEAIDGQGGYATFQVSLS